MYCCWTAPDGCASCRPALNYYLLCAWPGEYVDDARAEGILLRRMAAHRLEGQYVRVTIGTHEENDRFLDVFVRGVPGASARTA